MPRGFNPTLVRFELDGVRSLRGLRSWFQSHIGPI